MKRIFKTFISGFIAVTLLFGCGVNKTQASRIDGQSFTFTAEEFKNYFNSEIDSELKLKDFKGSASEELNCYVYETRLNGFLIYAISDAKDGKLESVSITSADGIGKTDIKSLTSKAKLSEDKINDLIKYSLVLFHVCSPNKDAGEFEKRLSKFLKDPDAPKKDSNEFGDLRVYFHAIGNIDISFEPKSHK